MTAPDPVRLAALRNLRARVDAEIAELEAAETAARAAARVVKRARWDEATCGTDGGYYRHRRKLKERACPDCINAHAAAGRGREARRRAAAAEQVAA